MIKRHNVSERVFPLPKQYANLRYFLCLLTPLYPREVITGYEVYIQ